MNQTRTSMSTVHKDFSFDFNEREVMGLTWAAWASVSEGSTMPGAGYRGAVGNSIALFFADAASPGYR